MFFQFRRKLCFPINRPLTEQEIEDHLEQKVPRKVVPDYMGSLIKTNITYMETLDIFFHEKGRMTALAGSMLLLFLFGMLSMLFRDFILWPASTFWNHYSSWGDVFTTYSILIVPMAFFFGSSRNGGEMR
nr:hypothetical protein [uncultured Holophaga sp.]